MQRLFIIACLFASLRSYAQSDSLVYWNELKFGTSFEKEAFSSFLKKNEHDFLKMMLANDPTADTDLKKFQQKNQKVLDEIKSSGNLDKKNTKKIKYLYELIHEKYFTQYENENRFYEIIQTGKYNCVTATALYAWFFEQLSIPYVIKEEPTHVYLVAYPNSDNIMVESTSPVKGSYSFTPDFKSSYVQNLKDQKIIGPSESSAATSDALFNKYYFGNENISFRQLIGIHYMNDALYHRDHDNWDASLEQIRKGYLYYPGTRSEFLLTSLTAIAMEETADYLRKASMIAYVARMKKSGITSEMVLGEFQRLTEAVLIKKNDRVLHKKCYEEIVRTLTDKALVKDITYHYNYENGRLYYNTGNYAHARPFLLRALEQEPDNADLGAIVVSCVAESLRNEAARASADTLDGYRTRFPVLNQNNNFNSILAVAYVATFGEAYEAGKTLEGDQYRKMFEDLYANNKNIRISPDIVGQAYSVACTYYFKRGQKAKANQFLDAGLKIVPNNHQLKARKQMIN